MIFTTYYYTLKNEAKEDSAKVTSDMKLFFLMSQIIRNNRNQLYIIIAWS